MRLIAALSSCGCWRGRRATPSTIFIQSSLARLGHAQPRETIRTDLAWLVGQELITTEVLDFDIIVAIITRRGVEAAQGLLAIEGVSRPSPKAG